MLIIAKQIRKCTIEGTDGTVGTIKDLLFDDKKWKVRYLDIDTGRWLSDRRVVLSPEVIRATDYAGGRLTAPLTREQVENSPSLQSHLPVSRQHEMELARYYAWGAYWANAEWTREGGAEEGDPHLRSSQSVSSYRVQAMDGEIGHVDDFVVDDEAFEDGPWEIRYLVIDTRNWLRGKRVLVPPLWAESIDWGSKHIQVGLSREMIENSPEYDPASPVNRQYEEVFYDYYGRRKYWKEASHTS